MSQRWINPQADKVASFEPVDDFVNGSHLLGYVRTRYDDLVEMFGEPNCPPGDKTWNSWDIEFTIYDKVGEVEDTVYCNIYDWKEADHSVSRYGDQNGEYDWHIGGINKEADYLLYDLMGRSPKPEYRFFRKGV